MSEAPPAGPAEPARGTASGLAAMIGACTIWGLSPVFYDLIAHVPPVEVLAHRTLWSALLFLGLLGLRRRAGQVPRLLRDRGRAGRVAAAALAISFNWGIFIFAVQAGRVVEASLGYYIFPLVSVGLGAALFGERLSRAQAIAVALAALAVLQLVWGLGAAPWISLGLAGSFGFYGALKKSLAADPVVSVTAEVVVLLIPALWWIWQIVPGWGAFSGSTAFLLVTTGPLTAVPLILFTHASRRLELATVGVLSYVNPSLQFLCAAVIFGEPLTLWHAVAFALIWTALALYSGEALNRRRRRRVAI